MTTKKWATLTINLRNLSKEDKKRWEKFKKSGHVCSRLKKRYNVDHVYIMS